MLNLLTECVKFYFHYLVIGLVSIFIISTVANAAKVPKEPKVIRLSSQEIAAMSVQKKCAKVTLKIGEQLQLKNELVEIEGVGSFSLNYLLDSTPLTMVFGIINLNNEGKKFEAALNEVGINEWSVKVTVYGLQATRDLEIVVKAKESIFEFEVKSEFLKFKGRALPSVTYLCE